MYDLGSLGLKSNPVLLAVSFGEYPGLGNFSGSLSGAGADEAIGDVPHKSMGNGHSCRHTP